MIGGIPVSQIAKEIQEDTERETAKKLLARGDSMEKIVEVTDLSHEEVKAIESQLH